VFEYSAESFTGTELEFARDICAAVGDVYKPTPQNKMIITCRATVEMASANIYADQVEWAIATQYRDDGAEPDPHNDRGTGGGGGRASATWPAPIASRAACFRHGERTAMSTGDLGLNMFTRVSIPRSTSPTSRDHARRVEIPLGASASPDGGDLGSPPSRLAQDAINKASGAAIVEQQGLGGVLYLPDSTRRSRPAAYEAIIRINSQSGKAGIATVLKKRLPASDMPPFSMSSSPTMIQQIADETGKEIQPVRDLGDVSAGSISRTPRRWTRQPHHGAEPDIPTCVFSTPR